VLAREAGSVTVLEQPPVRLSDVHRQSPSESRNSGLAALDVVSVLHSAERVVVAELLPNNSQVQFLQLEDDGGMCGSDNKERVEALGLHPGSNSQEPSAPSSTSELATDGASSKSRQMWSATWSTSTPSPSNVLWAVPSTERLMWAL
jgi:hypothetical protein